jgi:predicted ArsR family transcriptional regulator
MLKHEGPHESQVIARRLGVTTMAVRQHLYDLSAQGVVTHEPQARPVGRPAKMWALTPSALSHFPDSHAELTVSLLGAMQQAFGDDGLDQLLEVRQQQLLQTYRSRVPARGPLRRRVEALAALRTAEGYMATVETDADGVLLLVENHCPICAAASACQRLCAIELEVFQGLLGPKVLVTRTDHIQAGARRCAYRVEPHPNDRANAISG